MADIVYTGGPAVIQGVDDDTPTELEPNLLQVALQDLADTDGPVTTGRCATVSAFVVDVPDDATVTIDGAPADDPAGLVGAAIRHAIVRAVDNVL